MWAKVRNFSIFDKNDIKPIMSYHSKAEMIKPLIIALSPLKKQFTLMKKVHVRLYQYSVAFFFFLLWPLLYFTSRKPERYPLMNILRRIIAFSSSALAGIFYRIKSEQPINWSRTFIICPNHTSNLDIMSISLVVRNNFCFMGKDELLKNPVTGMFFKTIDIPVNRESKMSSFRAFKKAAERLESGMSLVIFPEGTIPDDCPPTLHPFKNGPFRLAIALKIPIIPVTSLNTWKVLWDTGLKHGSRPGICDIFVHKPIETAGMSIDDADALRDEVYSVIKKKLDEHDH
jgi:1-acyl-sn-glycerol-3-phosphate acyltransferase